MNYTLVTSVEVRTGSSDEGRRLLMILPRLEESHLASERERERKKERGRKFEERDDVIVDR